MARRCLLYYITDRSRFPGNEYDRRRALLAKIMEAARANIECIQLREKDLPTRELEELAREAVAELRKLEAENGGLKTILLVNSRADIALTVGADGVHLRSDDISPSDLRSLWVSCRAGYLGEPLPFIAVSCHSPSDVSRAQEEGADFAVFAPVFEKKDASGVEPQGLAALREASLAKIPVLALGGVTIENAASCLEAGAAGIAGIRLFQENRVEDVARILRAIPL